MPTNTPNLNLTTYDISTEGSVLFINAWENLIGTLSTSNMNKLDGFAGTTTATLQLLQDRPGSTHISATTADGVNYTATVSGLTSLSSGMIIYLEPDDVNTGNPYLNINSLGNKTMYKIDVDGVAIQLEPGDLIPTRKILLVYDGFSWYATGGINLSDYKISGAIGSLIAIGSSNQPVASSIVLSGGKIGAESIKFDSTLNKDVGNNLMLGDSGITPGTYKGTTYDKYGRATDSSNKVKGNSEINITSGVRDNLVSINFTGGIGDSGYSPSSFSLSTHNHSETYLPIGGKAADSDKLDGLDSTAFVQASALGAWSNWTPTVTYAGGTTDPTSHSFSFARWSRIGNMIFYAFLINIVRGSGDRTTIYVSCPTNSGGGAMAGTGYTSYASSLYDAPRGSLVVGKVNAMDKIAITLPSAMTGSGSVTASGFYEYAA